MKITKFRLMEIINEELVQILNDAQALTAADLQRMRDEDDEDTGPATAQAHKNIEDFIRAMQAKKGGEGMDQNAVLQVREPKSSVPSMSQLMTPGGDTQSMAPAGPTRAMPIGVAGDEGGYEDLARIIIKQAKGEEAAQDPKEIANMVNILKQSDADREKRQKPSFKQKVLNMFKEEYSAYIAAKLHESIGAHLTPVAQQLAAAGIAKQPESVRRDLMQLVMDLDFQDPTDIEELGMMVSQLIDAAGENIEGDYGLEEELEAYLAEKKKYKDSFYKAKEKKADELMASGTDEDDAYGIADTIVSKQGKKKKKSKRK